jgi:transposase
VPIKTVEQQSILALHRSQSLLVRQRTTAINAARGLLSEFGVIAARGIRRIAELRQRMSRMAPALLPNEAREAIDAPFEHLDGLEQRIDKVEVRILGWHKSNEASQRLASAPGVGPMTAAANVAAVGDGTQFKSSRHFAAWPRLTPRIRASGRKECIGRISKGGDRYLRTLLIHGARAVVGTLFRKDVRPRPWLAALIGRRPVNVAATAVAHKTARALWAMLTRAERYRAPAGSRLAINGFGQGLALLIDPRLLDRLTLADGRVSTVWA